MYNKFEAMTKKNDLKCLFYKWKEPNKNYINKPDIKLVFVSIPIKDDKMVHE